jgi:tRNA(Ile)-lysidine synthase
MMINRFKRFIEDQRLFKPDEKILLAISGGIDSMVMWKLFEGIRCDYAVAHCNFHLRGPDSDEDEALVSKTADEYGIRLYKKSFETREYASVMGISIEMAARELRYQWFEEIRISEKFHAIATAHHTDDLLETFFINLVRKTGIRGLTGFRPKTEHLIRPMLFTNRQEIEDWALANNVEYRTDVTNSELIYQRNYVRHQIIPGLEKLNPAFRNNLAGTMANLREVEDFYQTEITRQIKRISNTGSEFPEIIISSLLKLPHPRQVLFEWMNQFGFNASTVDQVFSNLEGESGKMFFSPEHRLVIDRNSLIITTVNELRDKTFYIEKEDLEIFMPVHLTLTTTDAGNVVIENDPRMAFLDLDLLEFPLVMKRWHQGEYFQPFGMEGFKKISDFFIDQKISIPEKERTWIIYSGDKVVWITGLRIDNRFRISEKTKKALIIRLHLQS